jgi:sarcosine oxidase subunit gamma
MDSPLHAASALPSSADSRCDGVSIIARPPSTLLHLEGLRDGIGDRTLPQAGRCLSDGAGMVLSVAPDAWLRVGAGEDIPALQQRFKVVVDVSSAWTHLAVEGVKAVELLRKGCAIDLHPRMFPAGACCTTGFARMRVVLWRPDGQPRYEVLAARSHALSLWTWLIDAAAQYGAPQTEEPLP